MFKRLTIALAAAALTAALAFPASGQNRETDALITLTAQGRGQVVSADQSNSVTNSLRCVVNLTAVANQPTVIVSVQGKDQASGQYYNVASTAGIRGAGMTQLLVGNGISTGPLNPNGQLPQFWRLVATVLGISTATATGTVGCSATE